METFIPYLADRSFLSLIIRLVLTLYDLTHEAAKMLDRKYGTEPDYFTRSGWRAIKSFQEVALPLGNGRELS